MSTKLAVIILTYNQESMVKRCLNSLLQSNVEEVELIIADDCSRDKTHDVISCWLLKNGSSFYKTTFIKNQQNLGTVQNVINAVSLSEGEYLKLLAGDDWFTDGALDKIREYIKVNEFDVAFSRIVKGYTSKNGDILIEQDDRKYYDLSSFFSSNPTEQFEFLAVKNRLPAPAALFTRSFWNRIKLEQCQLVYTEDWAMWLLGTVIRARFVQIDIPLVVYYEHNASVSRKPNGKVFRRYAQDVAWTFEHIVLPNRKKLSSRTRFLVYCRYAVTKILASMPIPIAQRFAVLKNKLGR